MKLIFWILFVTVMAGKSFAAACTDTTFTLPSPTSGKINPDFINSAIKNCDTTGVSNVITFTIKSTDTAEIVLSKALELDFPKASKLVGSDKNGKPLKISVDPPIPSSTIIVKRQVEISKFVLINNKQNFSTYIVTFETGAKYSAISNCQFINNDLSTNLGAMIFVIPDTVLIERNVFRADSGAMHKAIEISDTRVVSGTSIRSNLFNNSYIELSGMNFEFLANTLVGTIDVGKFPVTILSNVDTNQFRIHYNLFAYRDNSAAMIKGTAADYSSKIIRNGFSSTAASPQLISGVTGLGSNILLAPGMSNYSLKDYPLIQMKTDLTLDPSGATFGILNPNFQNLKYSFPAISSASPFVDLGSQYAFLNFSGQLWDGSSKTLGSFTNRGTPSDLIPSPIKRGSAGERIQFQTVSNEPAKIKITKVELDTAYYDTALAAQNYYFFFSPQKSALSPNDTNSLSATVKATKATTNASPVGNEIILSRSQRQSDTLYAKVFQYKQAGLAHIRDEGAIGIITGFPKYPINDLTFKVDSKTEAALGKVTLSIAVGKESIDSVRVYRYNTSDKIVDSNTVIKTQGSLAITISAAEKGSYYFRAVPLGTVDGKTIAGSLSTKTETVSFYEFTGATAYVIPSNAACPPANNGTKGKELCSIAKALELFVGKAGTIVVSPGDPITELSITKADDNKITIIEEGFMNGDFSKPRQLIRGTSNAALTITGKNVEVKGFTIEMPVNASKSAVVISGTNVVLEGNVFRCSEKNATVNNAAIEINATNTLNAQVRNNVVWNYATQVLFTSSASKTVRVYNNTFVDPSKGSKGTKVGIRMADGVVGSLAALIYNNFFSGIETPYHSSVTASGLSLSANVYTKAATDELRNKEKVVLDIQNLSDAVSEVSDIQSIQMLSQLEHALKTPFECSDLSVSRTCSPLFAGATFDKDLTDEKIKDVFGRARTNKPDVGAFEFELGGNLLYGRLTLTVSKKTTSTTIQFELQSQNFDPAEADSVRVWWSLVSDTSFAKKAGTKSYPLSALGAGAIKDSATNLQPGTSYFFYSQFTKSGKKAFLFTANSQTDIVAGPGDCNFSANNVACPSPNSYSPVTGATWLKVRTTLSQPASGALVQQPTATPSPSTVNSVTFLPGFPTLEIFVKDDGLDAITNQKQSFELLLEADTLIDLSSQYLYDLGSGGTTLPQVVPFWSSVQDAASGKTRVTIKGYTKGKHSYAFGLPAVAVTGRTSQSIDTSSSLDFISTGSSDTSTIALSLTGEGFVNGNPLLLVSVVPVGSYMGKEPFDLANGQPAYFAKTYLVAPGLAALSDSLRLVVLTEYFRQMIKADTVGGLKPFDLDISALSRSEFLIPGQESPQLDAAGNLAQVSINFSFSKSAYPKINSQRKKSRSIEIVVGAFDGGRITWSSSYVRTQFDENLQEHELKTFKERTWHLISYPWLERDIDFNLSRVLGVPSAWDPNKMVIMKYKGSGSGSSAYSKYDGVNKVPYTADAGNAVWAASINQFSSLPSKASSLDYKPFQHSIPANVYQDFGLPFNFSIKWNDILEASSLTGTLRAWKYVSEVPEWLLLGDTSTVNPWEGIVFHSTVANTLTIPLLGVTKSALIPLAKRAVAPGWQAQLEVRDELASVRLALGKSLRSESVIPAPSIPGQRFWIYLNEPAINQLKEQKLSVSIQGADSLGHFGIWPLLTQYEGKGPGVTFRLKENNLPQGLNLYLVDAKRAQATVIDARSPLRLSSEQMREDGHYLVAGDDSFLQQVLTKMRLNPESRLLGLPNPFSSMVSLRFTSPAAQDLVDYILTVRDNRGRLVKRVSIRSSSEFNYNWDGSRSNGSLAPSGFYFVELEAKWAGKRYVSRLRLMKF